MPPLIWTIWTANALMQWGLLALILWRREWWRHAAFATFIAFCCLKTSLMMWIALFHGHIYFKLNSGLRVVALLLMLAAFVEVFAAVFRPYSTLPRGTLRWFRFVFLSLVIVSAAAAFALPGAAPGTFINAVMVANRSVSIAFCGAFGLTALTSWYYGLPWPPRTYGIGVGFLLYTFVDLFVAILSATRLGLEWADTLNAIGMLAYSLALITWLVYFASKEPVRRGLSLDDLQRFQEALDYPAQKVESVRKTL